MYLLDIWVVELVTSLLDVATPPLSCTGLSDDTEDCWVVGATVDLVVEETVAGVEETVAGVLVEEIMDSLVEEEATVFLDEEEDCFSSELMELDVVADEEASVLDEVAVEEDGDVDEEEDTEDEEDTVEETEEDTVEDTVEDAEEDTVEEDVELLEILPPLAKTAKSSWAWSYLP